jgi:hypothetical protein
MINRISRTRDITSSDRNNKITTEIYYSKGGINNFTSKDEKRGYYFSIIPEAYMDNGLKTYTGFSGAKTCILEVTRKSKSAYEKAKAMLDKYENEYLQTFCEQKGYTLVDINNYIEKERD